VDACLSIKRRELSKKLDPYLIPNLSVMLLEFVEFESEEETTNLEHLGLSKATSTGLLKLSLVKQEFSMLSIMHPTTSLVRTKTLVKNCIVQIDASPFAQWYLNHYGLNIGICCFIQVKRPKKPPKPQQNQKKLKKNWRKEPRIESSILKLLKSSLNKDCWLALALDLANQARADGYILEGKELEFYSKKIDQRKK
jgi:hypothetical protein